ncbi:hypothetical protein [Occultella kanbiaonis]|uniref:hypothetical protein n=1 Tax=Occultella kanbiaonis TaxID=2675754 RepID=UPI0013D192C8|nr:hypothetical protein [Occultella kanbiaonis]
MIPAGSVSAQEAQHTATTPTAHIAIHTHRDSARGHYDTTTGYLGEDWLADYDEANVAATVTAALARTRRTEGALPWTAETVNADRGGMGFWLENRGASHAAGINRADYLRRVASVNIVAAAAECDVELADVTITPAGLVRVEVNWATLAIPLMALAAELGLTSKSPFRHEGALRGVPVVLVRRTGAAIGRAS